MHESPREKLVKGTVASPRLDAVGSLAFGVSRTRMSRDVKAERVLVNGRLEADPAATVKVGDVIALEGRGEAVVQELAGPTRKGRTAVTVQRRTGGWTRTEGLE